MECNETSTKQKTPKRDTIEASSNDQSVIKGTEDEINVKGAQISHDWSLGLKDSLSGACCAVCRQQLWECRFRRIDACWLCI